MKAELKKLLQDRSNTVKDSFGQEYQGITIAEVSRIAGQTQSTLREVEIAALQEEIIPCRYYKNIPTIGREGQIKLLQSCAAVVGAGGLGGTVVELLARIGVGRLLIIDGETFSEDNLNRQVLCREKDLGRKKVERAGERIRAVNSSVEVVARDAFLTDENAEELLRGSQVVVDALDRISVRIVLEKAVARLDLPLVHGAIGGFLGEVATVFPGEEFLSTLYRDAGSGGIETILGTPTPTPALIAALQVMEVVKLLLRRGRPLQGKLLYLELEASLVSEIKFSP